MVEAMGWEDVTFVGYMAKELLPSKMNLVVWKMLGLY